MTEPADKLNVARALLAVAGTLLFFSAVSQVLEAILVGSAGGTGSGLTEYFAVLNQTRLLVAKIAFHALLAVLTGYLAAKIVGARELTFAGIAAAIQTISLAAGFTIGEYAALPLWTRVVLIMVTAPAMMIGAWVRMQARLARDAAPSSQVES